MTPISTLRDLMARRDAAEREVCAAIEDRDTFSNRRYLIATTERIVAGKALEEATHRHLPALLAVAEAAKTCVDTQNTHEYIASLERLEKALAPLTNPEHAS